MNFKINEVVMAITHTQYFKNIFTETQWSYLDALVKQVIEHESLEYIDKGDSRNETTKLAVYRFMTRKYGISTLVNILMSNWLLKIFEESHFIAKIEASSGIDNLELQRIQLNIMKPGDFVTAHTDSESDPSYRVSIVIRTKSDYTGGELVVYEGEDVKKFHQPTHSLLIMEPSNLHEVLPVISGSRNSICVFMGTNLQT